MTYMRGLCDCDETPCVCDQIDVTMFKGKSNLRHYRLVARWWMRPICWIRRKPTSYEVWR